MKLREIRYLDPFGEGIEDEWKNSQKAQVVFITGGQPDIFLNRLRELGLVDKMANLLSQDNLLVIGASAGALVLNETCFISEDEEYPQEKFTKGFSIRSDFICEVHYEPPRYGYLKNALKINDVIAIEENSALFCREDEKFSVGKVHFFGQNRSKNMNLSDPFCSRSSMEEGRGYICR